MVLCTNFTKAQDHQLMINSTWTPSTTNFLQSFPFPATTATATQHILVKGYNALATRGIIFGGNLGVSQHTFDYENYRGKWSFKGAWTKPTTLPSPGWGSILGIQYIIDYHRWDDYSAHFGLRERNTYELVPETPTYSDVRDAVISWGYEAGSGIIPNRLIFQSIVGTDPSISANHIATEWATILSNGNIGSGISTPTAQFQLKPLSSGSSGIPLMEMVDASGSSKFAFSKTGDLSLSGTVNLSGLLNFTTLGNGTNHQQIFIDENGGTYSGITSSTNPEQVWLVGGSSFTATGSKKIGTLSNTDLQFYGGNIHSFFIDGTSTDNKGFATFTKNMVIGGGNSNTGYPSGSFLTQDANYSLGIASSIKGNISHADWDEKGLIHCVAYDYNNYQFDVLTLGAEELSLFGGYHKITKTNSYFDGETRFTYIAPMIPATALVTGNNIGNSGDMFEEIWVKGALLNGSDRRLKENITPLEHGLKTILNLKTYSYNLKNIQGVKHYGYIAQELQKIFPNSIVGGKETDTSYLGVAYNEFVPISTLAIQQQQQIIDSLKQRLDLIFSSNPVKKDMSIATQKETLNQSPLLFQNHPNPFNGVTFIDYFLPANSTNAFLKVKDNNGKLINSFQLNHAGFGQVELDCRHFAAGTYYYSLIVNSKLIDTKIMVIAASRE